MRLKNTTSKSTNEAKRCMFFHTSSDAWSYTFQFKMVCGDENAERHTLIVSAVLVFHWAAFSWFSCRRWCSSSSSPSLRSSSCHQTHPWMNCPFPVSAPHSRISPSAPAVGSLSAFSLSRFAPVLVFVPAAELPLEKTPQVASGSSKEISPVFCCSSNDLLLAASSPPPPSAAVLAEPWSACGLFWKTWSKIKTLAQSNLALTQILVWFQKKDGSVLLHSSSADNQMWQYLPNWSEGSFCLPVSYTFFFWGSYIIHREKQKEGHRETCSKPFVKLGF